MSEEGFLARQRQRIGGEKAAAQYTAKDFQLEVLDKLAEVEGLALSLEGLRHELKGLKEQRLLKFDGRTLIALSAVALSIAGYVIQDARNSARQDNEIETTKARVMRLEQIAAANTEGRIRTEVELGELRQGQAEIKEMIAAHDRMTKKTTEKE